MQPYFCVVALPAGLLYLHTPYSCLTVINQGTRVSFFVLCLSLEKGVCLSDSSEDECLQEGSRESALWPLTTS